MAENVFIHDSADKVPPPQPGRHPLTPISGADFDRAPRRRWPVQAWIVLTVILAAILLWLGYRLDAALRDLFERYPRAGDALLWLLVLAAVLGTFGALFTLAARAWVNIQHLRVVRSRLGTPQDVVQVVRQDPYAAEQQAIALETVRAQYMQYPNLSTLSQPAAPKVADVPQLPSPAEPGLALVPEHEWLSWCDDASHTLIAGETKAGKTTLARVLLASRLREGARALILDPKGKDWYGLPVVGGGWKMADIMDALDDVRAELETRYAAYGDGERAFPPLVVLVDEVPAIVDAGKDLNRRRWERASWPLFARQIGSLAREVNMALLLVTQSPNVEDIGINGAMRRNFARVALQDAATLLIDDDRNAARRKLLHAALAGLPYRAAMAYRGQVHACATAQIPMLASQSLYALPLAWSVAPRSAPLRADADELLSGLLDGARSTEQASERDARAIALFRDGATFRQVGELLRADGYTVANAELVDLRRQALDDAA